MSAGECPMRADQEPGAVSLAASRRAAVGRHSHRGVASPGSDPECNFALVPFSVTRSHPLGLSQKSQEPGMATCRAVSSPPFTALGK